MYIVMTASADGFYVEQVDAATLTKRLNETIGEAGRTWATAMPTENDPNYWGDLGVILKAKVVTPKPVETVTEYTIE